MTPDLCSKWENLLAALRTLEGGVVAFSGGVDSAVVALAAWKALPGKAVAITGVSASLASGELEIARDVAARIGIPHQILETDEVEDPRYRRNEPDRCYWCKSELYDRLAREADARGWPCVFSGANADDLRDFRPGLRAASERAVRHPLAEARLTKAEVREIAHAHGLPVWDKPATPCLSSRVAYGVEVTPERLAAVDGAEKLLRGAGFSPVRVRYHAGDVARIEVEAAQAARLLREAESWTARLRGLGFRFVTLDLEGFRSGSLQRLVPVETLQRWE